MDDINSLTRILRDMGINGGMPEEYSSYQAQPEIVFQGEIAGSNSFGPFPQVPWTHICLTLSLVNCEKPIYHVCILFFSIHSSYDYTE